MEKITRNQLLVIVVVLLLLLGGQGVSTLWDKTLGEITTRITDRILIQGAILGEGGK